MEKLANFKISILTSLLLHLGLAIAFLISPNLNRTSPTEQKVELIYPSGSSRTAREKSFSEKKVKFQKKSLQQNGLLFPTQNEIIVQSLKNPNLYKQKLDWENSMAYSEDLSNGAGEVTRAQSKFLKNFWQLVDDSIWESPYLAEYGHFGKVYLRFEIQDGKLIEPSIQASARDGILKVIALKSIRKAVQRSEIELPTDRIEIAARFSWTDRTSCQVLKGTFKNTLSFCELDGDKRKSFTAGEKAKTYLKALQYGFGAIDEIKQYKREEFRRETQFDPFDELRNDPDYNI